MHCFGHYAPEEIYPCPLPDNRAVWKQQMGVKGLFSTIFIYIWNRLVMHYSCIYCFIQAVGERIVCRIKTKLKLSHMILTGLQESNLVRKCLNLVTSDPLCITCSHYILFVIVKIWITGALTGFSPFHFFFLAKIFIVWKHPKQFSRIT